MPEKMDINKDDIGVVQGGEVVLPQSDDGLYKDDGVMDAYEVFKRVSMHNVMRAIQRDDLFGYAFVDFTMEQIECRKKYKLTIIYNKDDPSTNEEKIIEARDEEEGRMYRDIYKHPESAFLALIDHRDTVDDEWESEIILHYDKGPVSRGIVDACTKVLQVALDHKRFKDLQELKDFTNKYLVKKQQEAKDAKIRENFLKSLGK